MTNTPISLSVFTQLLEPAGIAPALDFAQTRELVFESLPSSQLRSRIRFVIDANARFRPSQADEVKRLLRHWRAELSPTIDAGTDELMVSGFEDDKHLRTWHRKRPLSGWSITCLPARLI